MAFDTIIKSGRVVTATDSYVAYVGIADGKITAIGQDLPQQNAAKILNATGKLVFPGGIDVHTHLDMPFGGTTSADDFETVPRLKRLRRVHHRAHLPVITQQPLDDVTTDESAGAGNENHGCDSTR